MSRTNRPQAPIHTHEGARAPRINVEMQLRRSVMACCGRANSTRTDARSQVESRPWYRMSV